jgi:hypothetical protein
VAPVAGAELVPPAVLPLPVPEVFAGVLAGGELEVGAELDGGGDLGLDTLTESLADGHGGLDDAAVAWVPDGWLTGAELALIPGTGVLLPGPGDGDSLGDVEAAGGVELVGGLVGPALVEPVGPVGGLDLAAAGVVQCGGAAVGAAEWRPPDVGCALEASCVPPPLPPPLPPPPLWVEPLFEEPSADEEELGEMACGSSVRAKPPAATTKTAMPMPATGRIQPYRGRAWPGLAGVGRKRSTTAQKAATTGSIQRRSQAAVPADQADADSNDSIGRFSRSLIRSSPSADGSIESAAACSARRRASS